MRHLQRLEPDAREQDLRDFPGGFDFRGERALAPVSEMSGGEKARLTLALLVRQRPNLLRATADELWLVHEGRIAPFDGDLDDYRDWMLGLRRLEAEWLEIAEALERLEAQNAAGFDKLGQPT